MTAIEDLLQVAAAEVGYLEKRTAADLDSKLSNAGSNNYTKYARDYFPSLQGQPWCDMFVDWCVITTFGKSLAAKMIGGFDAYTPASADKYRRMNRWFVSPEVGDQIFFKNEKRIYHTGIVEKVESGRVYTIEGNTSNGSEVVANGGAVCRKSYPLSHPRIAGYGRPRWDLAASTAERKYANGWNKNDIGWWYVYDDKDNYHINNAVRINNKLYFFDAEGYCVKNPTVSTQESGELIHISGERVK